MTDQNEQGKDDGRRGDDYSNIEVTNSSGTAIGPGSRAAVNLKSEQATAEPKKSFVARCWNLIKKSGPLARAIAWLAMKFGMPIN